MKVQDLVKYTKLSGLDVNMLAADAGYPTKSLSDEVPMQVVVRVVMADVFVGCYPDRKLEILTYLRAADIDGLVTRGIETFISTLEDLQNKKIKASSMPTLMLTVTDSRFISLITGMEAPFIELYDMVNGTMCSIEEVKWPWMSMTMHICTMMLRDRTFIPDYKNVALGTDEDGMPALIRLDHPVQADTELK